MAKLEIHQFPCLSDNYGVLIHDAEQGVTASIDAPDARTVAAALEEKGWTLTHILTTHHHGDHTGGNAALKAETSCTIIGPRNEAAKIPGIDKPGGRGRHVHVRRARGAGARHAWPHGRAYHLCLSGGQGGLRRRHAVRHRLRTRHRGQCPDDVAVAEEADGAAEGHRRSTAATSTRRPTPASRSPSSRRTRRCRSGPRRSTSSAPPAGRPCRPPSASSWRPIRSCGRTWRPSRSASAWRASPSGRSSARSASARTGVEHNLCPTLQSGRVSPRSHRLARIERSVDGTEYRRMCGRP